MSDGKAWLSVLTLQSAKDGARIVLDTATDPANPIQRVYDPTPVARVELGSLAANGNSPSQWGVRVNNASGNPFFDSLGLFAGVMAQPAASIHEGVFWSTTSTTAVSMTGSSITFTLSRQLTVLFVADVACNVIGAAPGNWGYASVAVDGVGRADGTFDFWSLGGGVSTAPLFWSGSLGAGSHTVEIRGRVDNGSVTLQKFSSDLYIFQLGQ